MTWVRLDDGFPSHPKVLKVNDHAFRGFIIALCYSGQHLTDGVVPAGVVTPRVAKSLVAAGLFDTLPTSPPWLIHDYLRYNPSKSAAEKRTRASRYANQVRWEELSFSDSDFDSDSDSDRNGTRGRDGTGQSKKEHARFEAFYAAFPRHVGRLAAVRAFELAVGRGADPDQIIAGAARYAADPQRTTQYTTYPATWLNQGRWMDETTVQSPDRSTNPANVVGTPEWNQRVRREEDEAIDRSKDAWSVEAALTFACAKGNHEGCTRRACICECHTGGSPAKRPDEPDPVAGTGRATPPIEAEVTE